LNLQPQHLERCTPCPSDSEKSLLWRAVSRALHSTGDSADDNLLLLLVIGIGADGGGTLLNSSFISKDKTTGLAAPRDNVGSYSTKTRNFPLFPLF